MKVILSTTEKTKSPPKVFAWLASALLIILIAASQFLPRGHYPHLRIPGVISLLTAPVFIFTPFFLLSGHKKKDGQVYMQTSEVADRSLFAVVRHPQYLGYMLLAVGFSLLSQNLIILVLAILTIIFFYLQTIKEEEYCLTHFGKTYRNYLRRVPRFNIFLGLYRIFRRKKND